MLVTATVMVVTMRPATTMRPAIAATVTAINTPSIPAIERLIIARVTTLIGAAGVGAAIKRCGA